MASSPCHERTPLLPSAPVDGVWVARRMAAAEAERELHLVKAGSTSKVGLRNAHVARLSRKEVAGCKACESSCDGDSSPSAKDRWFRYVDRTKRPWLHGTPGAGRREIVRVEEAVLRDAGSPYWPNDC